MSDSARFVVEHTRVESFENQISDGKRFSDLLGSLERSLVASLPLGTYEVIIPSLAARSVPGKQAEAVCAALKAWVIETARALKLGPDGDFAETDRVDERPWSITAQPPGVPSEVTLQRRPPDDRVVVFVMRFMPPEIEESRRSRIRTALARKCPKLAEAKQQHDPLSVLLLESDDIALANRHVISEAVVGELAARTDRPDFVFLVETDRGLAWLLWIVKDGDEQYPAIEEPGPFEVDHQIDASVSGPANCMSICFATKSSNRLQCATRGKGRVRHQFSRPRAFENTPAPVPTAPAEASTNSHVTIRTVPFA